MRYKLSQKYGICQSCYLPRLSTDGRQVVCCACGDVSSVGEWNERIQRTARRLLKWTRARNQPHLVPPSGS